MQVTYEILSLWSNLLTLYFYEPQKNAKTVKPFELYNLFHTIPFFVVYLGLVLCVGVLINNNSLFKYNTLFLQAL